MRIIAWFITFDWIFFFCGLCCNRAFMNVNHWKSRNELTLWSLYASKWKRLQATHKKMIAWKVSNETLVGWTSSKLKNAGPETLVRRSWSKWRLHPASWIIARAPLTRNFFTLYVSFGRSLVVMYIHFTNSKSTDNILPSPVYIFIIQQMTLLFYTWLCMKCLIFQFHNSGKKIKNHDGLSLHNVEEEQITMEKRVEIVELPL